MEIKKTKVFLSADWKNLLMLNWAVEDSLLMPYLPCGVELDKYNGKSYVSLVAFQFLNTRVKGLLIPFHSDFEEVNLRFYVKRVVNGETRRGVVFIKEIVPKFMIAYVARVFYGERYFSAPMSHKIENLGDKLQLEYTWFNKRVANRIQVMVSKEIKPLLAESEQEFIAEHYWGYSKSWKGITTEYRVDHPRWEYADVQEYKVECDFDREYGKEFGFLNNLSPDSCFYLVGSKVEVFEGIRLSNP